MGLANIIPENGPSAEIESLCLGVIALHQLTAPFSELPLFQMGLVKVIVPNGRSTMWKLYPFIDVCTIEGCPPRIVPHQLITDSVRRIPCIL